MQLRFLQKNKEEKDMIIAVAGSGGKTTRVHKLAQYYRSLGKKVFVTTKSHMKKGSDTVITENIEEILVTTTTLTIIEIHRNRSKDHHPLHTRRIKEMGNH